MNQKRINNVFYIYIHQKPLNGEVFYVGKGKDNRIYSKKRNIYWKRIVNKYGFEAIKIEENLNEIDALNSEQYWISQFKSWGFKLCNMTNGGEGISGMKHSEKTKEKISKKNKGKKNNLGFKHSEETKKKLSDIKKGKRLSINTEFKKGNIPWIKNKKHSEKTKEKISEKLKGKPGYWINKKRIFSIEHKKKLSFPVIIFGKEFYSIKEASRKLKISESTIIYRLKNIKEVNYIYK